ncbi:hypothetical protein CHS0354_009478 [Potamilus streckersoni]|uniref:Uncharacterized protein n=1 Tax=Potamilus streckersoni TaxID=2493646 RepID=A0AAE0RVS3_9BIVA|nr:hypothetical protein CHS0354_009478 [Potamilus streckersoni]
MGRYEIYQRMSNRSFNGHVSQSKFNYRILLRPIVPSFICPKRNGTMTMKRCVNRRQQGYHAMF